MNGKTIKGDILSHLSVKTVVYEQLEPKREIGVRLTEAPVFLYRVAVDDML